MKGPLSTGIFHRWLSISQTSDEQSDKLHVQYRVEIPKDEKGPTFLQYLQLTEDSKTALHKLPTLLFRQTPWNFKALHPRINAGSFFIRVTASEHQPQYPQPHRSTPIPTISIHNVFNNPKDNQLTLIRWCFKNPAPTSKPLLFAGKKFFKTKRMTCTYLQLVYNTFLTLHTTIINDIHYPHSFFFSRQSICLAFMLF